MTNDAEDRAHAIEIITRYLSELVPHSHGAKQALAEFKAGNVETAMDLLDDASDRFRCDDRAETAKWLINEMDSML